MNGLLRGNASYLMFKDTILEWWTWKHTRIGIIGVLALMVELPLVGLIYMGEKAEKFDNWFIKLVHKAQGRI